MVKRFSWKAKTQFDIFTATVLMQNSVSQSWLCFTWRQGLTRWTLTAGCRLICACTGREQQWQFGFDVAAAKPCCSGSSVCMCASRPKADLSFSSQRQPFALLLHCLQLTMVFGFCGLRLFSTRSSVTWPGDVAGVTESPVGRCFTKCVA